VRILFVATDFVWPPVRGGRVRTLSQLRVLASLTEVERIRLFSLQEEPVSSEDRSALEREVPKVEALTPVFHPIHLMAHPRYLPRVAWLRVARGVPYVSAKWESPAVRAALERELRRSVFDVVWLDGLGSARYLPLIRRVQPRARVVLDQHNVESERFRQFALAQRGARQLVAREEWRAARTFERETLRAVDAVGAISPEDAHAYVELADIEAITVPQVVPFVRRTAPAPDEKRIAYVGSLSWYPNARGLDWFCAEVWPEVRRRLPGATLEIAGSGLPTDEQGRAVPPPAWRLPGIETLGFVSDLGPLYERSAALVAPVLGGSGIRIKLLEAFRSGVPAVTTPDGAAGLPIVPGREAFVESDPRAFAERVALVVSSTEVQMRLRDAAYAFLERHHSLGAAQRAARGLLDASSYGRTVRAGAAVDRVVNSSNAAP
jgi:glycosyltransferase involved in cell wall biosynthesis